VDDRPVFHICQLLYNFGEELNFTRIGDVSGGVSDCEELEEFLTEGEWGCR